VESEEILKDHYCSKIINQIYEREQSGREKFQLLCTLVKDLFKSKNSKYFTTISNLIITALTSFNDNHPIDKYSRNIKKEEKDPEDEHIEIMKKEYFQAIKEYKYTLSIGSEFLDVIKRFSNEYRGVANVEFCPKVRNN